MALSETIKSVLSEASAEPLFSATELTAPDRATCPKGSSLGVSPQWEHRGKAVPWGSYLVEKNDEQLT